MRAFLCRVQVRSFNVRTKERSRAGYVARAQRREDLSQSTLTLCDLGMVVAKQSISHRSGQRQRAYTGQGGDIPFGTPLP